VTRPLPDHLTDAPQTTTRQHSKGSDHDHHRNAEDGRPTHHDREPTETANGDRADSPDGGDRSDTDRPRRTRPGTAVRRAERAGDDSPPPPPNRETDAASRRIRAAAGRPRRRTVPQRPIPTPEEWAQEQLKHAPERSRAWAAKVAAIYGLELPADARPGS
jgi:hypothetical protein